MPLCFFLFRFNDIFKKAVHSLTLKVFLINVISSVATVKFLGMGRTDIE